MKKILFLSFVLLALVSCTKEDKNEPTTDARDAFVGTYNLHVTCRFQVQQTGIAAIDSLLPDSIPYSYDCEMTITKDESDAAKVIIKSDLYNCSALAAGNHLTLESESVQNQKYNFGGTTISLSYTMVHGTADLNNNVITWHSDGSGSGSISAFTLSGSASLDNVATKK